MTLTTTLITGLVLGGTYALVAMGLTLQYGIARIMNLAYGDMIITAAFATFIIQALPVLNPLLSLFIVVPAGFILGYLIYTLVLSPLVKRAPNRGALEVDSILTTFGLLFVIQGVLLVIFGGNYTSYSFLNVPVDLFGTTVAANRLAALVLALIVGCVFYLLLTRTRWGTALRAVAVAPQSAQLVGININRAAAFAFALGTGLAGAGGVVISMYQTFTAASGVVFTMKALIVVIMGGVGDLVGALIAGLLLGVVETLVSTYVDPGLTLAATYALFLLVLLLRPQGLFGRAAA